MEIMIHNFLFIADEFSMSVGEVMKMPCATSQCYESYLMKKHKKPEEMRGSNNMKENFFK